MRCLITIAIILITLPGNTADIKNLVRNGNFERISKDTVYSWNWNKKDAIKRVKIEGLPGQKYCLQLNSESKTATEKKRKHYVGICQTVYSDIQTAYLKKIKNKFTPGQTYKISFYARNLGKGQIPFSVLFHGRAQNRKKFCFRAKLFYITPSWKGHSFEYTFSKNKFTTPLLYLGFNLYYGSAQIAGITMTPVTKQKKIESSGQIAIQGRKNLLFNSGFELSWQYLIPANFCDNNGEELPPVFDTKIRQSGNYSLKLSPYNGIKTIRYNVDPEKTYTLSFYVRGDSPDKSRDCAKVMVATPGWHTSSTIIPVLTSKWKRYSKTFHAKKLCKIKRKKNCSPTEKNTVYLRIASGKYPVWFDSFQLEEGTQATKYNPGINIGFNTKKENAVYEKGKSDKTEIIISHLGGLKEDCSLICQIKDIYNKTLSSQKYSLKKTKQNMSKIQVPIPCENLGVIALTIKLKTNTDRILALSDWRYLVVNSLKPFRNKWLGYNTSCIDARSFWFDQKAAPIFQLLGCCKIKAWGFCDYKHLKKKSSPAEKIALIKKRNLMLQKYNIETSTFFVNRLGGVLMKSHWPDNIISGPADDKKYVDDFIKLTDKYKGCFNSFAVFNEPNLSRTKSGVPIMPPERLVKIYRAIHEKQLAEKKKFSIVGSMNGTDFTYLKKLLNNGGAKYINTINFQAYRATPESPSLYDDMDSITKLVRSYNPRISLANMEQYYGLRHKFLEGGEFRIGYCTSSEIDHAGRMVQNFLHHLAADFSWYFFAQNACLFRLGGVNPVFYYFNFGGMRNASMLLQKTKNATVINSHKFVRTFCFNLDDGSHIVSINTRDFGKKGKIKRPLQCKSILDFNGNPINSDSIEISYLPSYILYDKSVDIKSIKQHFANTSYYGLGVPVDVAFNINPADKNIVIILTNQSTLTQNGNISFKHFSKKIRLPQNLKFSLKPKSTMSFKFNQPAQLEWKNDSKIEYDISNEKGAEKRLGKLPVLSIVESPQAIIVDSDKLQWLKLGNTRLLTKESNASAKTNDFQADVAWAWNNKGIFLTVKVKDSTPLFGGGCYGSCYMHDSLQVYFDQGNNARDIDRYDSDDVVYQIGLTDNGKPVAWLEKNPSGRFVGASNTPTGIDASVKVNFRKIPDGYRWECFFPQEVLPQLKLSKGTAFGLGLMVWDKFTNSQRNGYIIGDSVKKECYRRPYNWTTAILK
jgi:Carbohydrate family 9 binding domain-like